MFIWIPPLSRGEYGLCRFRKVQADGHPTTKLRSYVVGDGKWLILAPTLSGELYDMGKVEISV